MGAILLVMLAVQVRARSYVPVIYWLTVVLLSIVGTLITDNLTDVAGVSLFVSTGTFLALLAATFGVWFARERTLSIHTIITRPRELFYWAAILFTFSLGTSAGDHASVWSRRAKIDIHDIPPALLVPDAVLEVHLPGRG